MKNTPHQRAESLLKLHSGSCSVYGISDIANAFREMEKGGLVKIEPAFDLASGMINVREAQHASH